MTLDSKRLRVALCEILLALCAAAATIGGAAVAAGPTTGDKQDYEFALTKGSGDRVCEAYLLRLRATQFAKPPYCGRLENATVLGFERLRRVPLAADEIVALFPRIQSRSIHGDQYAQEQIDASNRSRGVRAPTSARPIDALVSSYVASGSLSVWRYDPPIDIENDGSKDNLIVWYGAAAGVAKGPCGAESTNTSGTIRQSQLALFLTTDDKAVDEARTMRVFGHPGWESAQVPLPYPQRIQYLVLVLNELGVFAASDAQQAATGQQESKRLGSGMFRSGPVAGILSAQSRAENADVCIDDGEAACCA